MKKEIKIAIVAIVALVALYFGLNFLKGARLFSDNNEYFLSFRNVDGVAKNCPIYAEGIAVGEVGDILYDYTHKNPTRIVASLKKKMVIPQGTMAEIHTDLMGNTQVSLVLGDYSNPPVEPGGVIEGNESDGTMEKVKEMVPAIENMLPKLDSIVSSLNTLLADPAISAMLHSTANTAANLDAATQQLDVLAAQLNSRLPDMLDRAGQLLDNSNQLAENLASIDMNGTMEQVNKTLGEVNTTITKINSPEGTLGKLVNDNALYDNLAAVMADADSLMIDLKANPKRYVHFSVFGKKDK